LEKWHIVVPVAWCLGKTQEDKRGAIRCTAHPKPYPRWLANGRTWISLCGLLHPLGGNMPAYAYSSASLSRGLAGSGVAPRQRPPHHHPRLGARRGRPCSESEGQRPTRTYARCVKQESRVSTRHRLDKGNSQNEPTGRKLQEAAAHTEHSGCMRSYITTQ
jgi:hypothetical protein